MTWRPYLKYSIHFNPKQAQGYEIKTYKLKICMMVPKGAYNHMSKVPKSPLGGFGFIAIFQNGRHPYLTNLQKFHILSFNGHVVSHFVGISSQCSNNESYLQF